MKNERDKELDKLASDIAKDCIVTKALAKFLRQALEVAVEQATKQERERCAKIADDFSLGAFNDCECLGHMDPETGISECSLEVRGGDCLCLIRQETAEIISTKIMGKE